MSDEVRLVDVPAYAKQKKNGDWYALKRDMPYYADEADVSGYRVIGKPSEIPGKMIPRWDYDYFYSPEASARRKAEEEERRLREEKEAAEMKRTLGEKYVSLSDLQGEIPCYPINGYLVEKFFSLLMRLHRWSCCLSAND